MLGVRSHSGALYSTFLRTAFLPITDLLSLQLLELKNTFFFFCLWKQHLGHTEEEKNGKCFFFFFLFLFFNSFLKAVPSSQKDEKT